MLKKIFLLVTILLLYTNLFGVDYDKVYALLKESVDSADLLLEEGKAAEAYFLVTFAQSIYPEDARIKKIDDALSLEEKKITQPNPLLGFNYGRRKPRGNVNTTRKILFYLPDRFFDFIDMITFEVNVGPQLGGGFWYTRALQMNAYVGAHTGFGYSQKKQIGIRFESSAELGAGPIGLYTVAGAKFGTGGINSGAMASLINLPKQNIYQTYRDYWAFGGKMGTFVIGFIGEIHPIEIVDFLGGLVLWDMLNDDFTTTQKLSFKAEHKKLIKQLSKNVRKAKFEVMRAKYPTL